MKHIRLAIGIFAGLWLAASWPALAGQAPGAWPAKTGHEHASDKHDKRPMVRRICFIRSYFIFIESWDMCIPPAVPAAGDALVVGATIGCTGSPMASRIATISCCCVITIS